MSLGPDNFARVVARSVLALVLAVPLQASATSILVELKGTVTDVNGSGFGSVAVDDLASYAAVWDTEAVRDSFGVYRALSDINFVFGSFSGGADSGGVTVTYVPDIVGVVNAFSFYGDGLTFGNASPDGDGVGFAFWDTVTPISLLASNNSLPDPMSINWLGLADLATLYATKSDGSSISVKIQSVTTSPVPVSVPEGSASGVYLALGLAAVTLATRATRTVRT